MTSSQKLIPNPHMVQFINPETAIGVNTLDKRIHAYRSDLADLALKGRVEAARFVSGTPAVVTASLAPMLAAACGTATQISQLLLGENIRVFEDHDGWSWVQAEADGYVGYTPSSALNTVTQSQKATHVVAVPLTHLYPEPDIKIRPTMHLHAGTPLIIKGNNRHKGFIEVTGGWAILAHIRAPAPPNQADLITIARQFLGTPYLWGGRGGLGIDCSGLVQTTLRILGVACPRDSDQQAEALGADIGADLSQLNTGDLVFFPGHVGFMADKEYLLHANATHMAVTINPLSEVLKTIGRDHKNPVTALKRLNPGRPD